MDDAELWEAYAWPQRCLRVNFVTTLDGHVQGPDGLSGPLSNDEDRRIFHMLRAGCDAVLVGAGTARAENYKAISIKPEWHGLRGDTTTPTLVMVSASGRTPQIEGSVVVSGPDLAGLKQQYPRILCEGGPRLFTELLDLGLVDEVTLTISGRLGGTGSLVTQSMWQPAVPTHVHADGDSIYTRWRLT